MLILHLSDLHFGAHSRFRGRDPEELAGSFCRQLAASRKRLGIDAEVELVIVTGDFTETGDSREFQQAETFLGALVEGLEVPRRRTVLLPGNHDLSWAHCKIQELQQQIEHFDDDELRRRIDQVKLASYDDFVRRFYGDGGIDGVATRLTAGARVYQFPHYRLSVAAFNSCEVESHRPGDHRGLVSRAQARAVMAAWRTEDAAVWLKILAVHHNPDVTVPANLAAWKEKLRAELAETNDVEGLIARYESDAIGFEGRDQLEAIAKDCGAQLVLHGHHHASDSKSWNGGRSHVLSAGSLSLLSAKLPQDEPASVRLIEINAKKPEIRSWCLAYVSRARVEGEVEHGAFVPDPAEPDGLRFLMELPAGFEGSPGARPSKSGEAKDGWSSGFVEAYRQAFRPQFQRWELSMLGVATRPIGAPREFSADLDDMYLPIRLAPGFDISKTDRGEPISIDKLVAREKPLIVRGLAGSGKTTWVRWTFRRLIDRPDALPLVLILRDLAPHWKQGHGSERRLTRYLAVKMEERMDGQCEEELRRLLGASSGPRPILLVDGWDELGRLGDQVREGLRSLMEEFPQLLVVVTSRPYGEGRPSHAEGFEELDVQPLSDAEIGDLSARFFHNYHGADTDSATSETASFAQALDRSPEARDLARTLLLLTMMLFLSRSRRLPDKRHLLYDACVDNLLTHLPTRKADEGAVDADGHWFPTDGEERRQAVAALAHTLQEDGYTRKTRSAIGAPVDRLMEILPEAWKPDQRRGFLLWLVDRSGLLIDRANGELSFSHLSFQEYLAAWDLDVNLQTESERSATFRRLLRNPNWWETLRLWAAILSGRSRAQLEPIVAALIAGGGMSMALAAAIFADGLGSDEAFRRWAVAFAGDLAQGWPVEPALYAWAGSRQDGRRAELGRVIAAPAIEPSWLGWLRLREGAKTVSLAFPATTPPSSRAGSIVSVLEQRPTSSLAFGSARFLCGSHPLWPGRPLEVGLLQLWPGARRIAGLRLQALTACVGDDVTSRAEAAKLGCNGSSPPCLAEARNLARYWARFLARDWARDLARDWAYYLARDLARNLARDWAQHLRRGYLDRYLDRDWARDLARDWACYLARDWARLAPGTERDWARLLVLDPAIPGLSDFILVEAASPIGRAGARALIAALPETGDALERLFRESCLLSMHSDGDEGAFARATLTATRAGADPMFLALARHLARRSDDEDRQYLVHRVATAHEDDSPLGWGLRYIARGDVVLDGGEVVTLDELCDQHGLPRLPLLEEMPDELEVDWDDKGDGRTGEPPGAE